MLIQAGEAFAERHAVRAPDGSWLTHAYLHELARPVRAAIGASIAELGGAVGCLVGDTESLSVAVIASLTAAESATFLDPSVPEARNRQSLDDIDARTILTDRSCLGYARGIARAGERVILIQDPGPASHEPPTPPGSDALLTIFTSGSTGRPKGVRRSHASMLHTAHNLSQRYSADPDDRMLYVGSPGHVGTLNDVLLNLLNGHGAIPVHPSGIDLPAVWRTIVDLGVNKAAFPPSLLRLLLRHAMHHGGRDVRMMIASSGEALLRSDVGLFFETLAPGSILWQSYGSTEAGHMHAGFYTAHDAGGSGPLPLNSVARGVRIDVLGPDDTPVPEGTTGRVRVRTPSLTLGYLHPERHTDSGLGEDDAGRYFETGDRARVLADGVIQIEGRSDRQVSLHGRRLELGDVESAILDHPAWGEAAAAVIDDAGGRPVLMAMLSACSPEKESQAALRRRLLERLPSFAVPTRFLEVAALPRTMTGKVDPSAVRARLSAGSDDPEPNDGPPPTGPTENWIADAWQAVLGRARRPSRDARFDTLGGDSLDAVRLSMRLSEKFGTDVGMDFVTGNLTIAEQAAALQSHAVPGRRSPRLVALRSDGRGPVFVMLPGAGGHAWVYLPIVDALDTPCDFWAFNLDTADANELRADRLAERVLERLGETPAGRRLIVGGYSRGTHVACELAARLRARDAVPDGVALIDPSPLRDQNPVRRLPRSLSRRVRGAARSLRSQRAERALDHQIAVTRRHLGRLYRPGRTRLGPGHCGVICTTETGSELAENASLYGRPLSEIRITPVPDLDHLELMRRPGAARVGEWLATFAPEPKQQPDR